MVALNLDNLPDGMLIKIEQLAVKNNCSVQEQAIILLKQSLNQSQDKLKFLISPETDPTWEQRRKDVPKVLDEIRSRRRVNPANYDLPDSTELIREDRER